MWRDYEFLGELAALEKRISVSTVSVAMLLRALLARWRKLYTSRMARAAAETKYAEENWSPNSPVSIPNAPGACGEMT